MTTTNPKIRFKLWKQQDRKCHYCKFFIPFERSTLDHVIPKSKGGSNQEKNLVVACLRCNHLKGDKTWGSPIKSLKWWPAYLED